MTVRMKFGAGVAMLAEIQEFANFDIETQRYICCSLETARSKSAPEHWGRNDREAGDIRAQSHVYSLIPGIHESIPENEGFVDAENFLFPLIAMSTFDITCGPIVSFAEYRFLYERLFGSAIRPWLSSAFLSAASSPHLPAEIRQPLVKSAHDALTDHWSSSEPTFWPEWLAEHEELAA